MDPGADLVRSFIHPFTHSKVFTLRFVVRKDSVSYEVFGRYLRAASWL